MDQLALSPIEYTLVSQFQQGNELVRLFRLYNIEEFLQRIFGKLSNSSPDDPSFNLESYTSLILHELNQRLLKIDNLADRLLIKATLAELFQAYIISFIKPFPERIPKFIQAVKSTCDFHHYDYKDAYQFLRLYELEIPPVHEKGMNPKPVYRYHWVGNEKLFEDFIEELRIHDFIHSKKEIRSLFEPDSEFRCARIHSNKRLEFAIVIELLYANGLITVKGRNGKFKPLKEYIVVKDNEPLYKTDPSRLIERLKRKQSEMLTIERKIMTWLRPIISAHCGKAGVKGLLP